MTTTLSHPDALSEVMRVTPGDRDLDWIKRSLNVAIALELATLPPYLCAFWSIKNPDKRGVCRTASRLILGVVYEEMRHLGLVCNILNAVGGQPEIVSALPVYPTQLPGNVEPTLTVTLAGLTKEQVGTFMDIERPEQPLARRAAREYPTIGAFYTDLERAFRAVRPAISADRQINTRVIDLTAVTSLDDVTDALRSIKEQGEGTAQTPEPGGELAHYYRFGELYYERRLEFDEDTGTWAFNGEPVDFPRAEDIYPMAELPAGGWHRPSAKVRSRLDAFNDGLLGMLGLLESAWRSGSGDDLFRSIVEMTKLTPLATAVMELPIPGRSTHNYGPDFRNDRRTPSA